MTVTAIISKTTATLPPGKIKCYVTGKLRNDTPEENVRQRMARAIVEEYGYSVADLELERTIQLGTQKKRADIVIFANAQAHKNENIIVIVEAKRESVKPTHADQGINQLVSYLAATPNAEYGLWVGSEIRALRKEEKAGQLNLSNRSTSRQLTGKLRNQARFRPSFQLPMH
jgi:type I restriction enzyme M protein